MTTPEKLPPKLPAGQALTEKFPVVGELQPAPGWAAATCRIEVGGLVERTLTLTLADVLRLPQQQRTADIHCVTGWSRPQLTMRGVPLAAILALAGVCPDARFVRFVAQTSRGHDTSLPLALALADTWLVHEVDGQPLSSEHGGPLRTITPGRYFYKSLKWLARIELLADDQLGYWERESAYHNEADPWREQRFDESRIADAETVAAFRNADDFTAWRGKVLLKARLGGWLPRNQDLSAVQLKYCSLRRAQLAGVNWRGANLSLSNFEGADLRGSDFSEADVEGASFAGADLRGAIFRETALSATRFFRDFASGQRLAANVEGLQFTRPRGLLEAQAEFLRAQGVHWE
jgi:DMSO/TMAO reductase YedYZ molybdopterin-dependent catalytic subunit